MRLRRSSTNHDLKARAPGGYSVQPRAREFRRLSLGLVLLVGIACAPAGGSYGGPPPNRLRADSAEVKTDVAEPDTPLTYISEGTRPGIGNCPIYPRNNVFHADISRLPVREGSASTIAAVGADLPLGVGFYSAVWQGSRGGVPVNVVDSTTTEPVDVIGDTYSYLSDLEDHPIPPNPKIEGHPGIAWDKHMIVFDTATCVSSEFFYVTPPNFLFDRWVAATAVKLDLSSNSIRERGSAIASGMSMLALMVRYEEVRSGEIDHMLQIALPVIANTAPVWPASDTDGRSESPDAPPMGTVFRLRSDVDLSGFSPDALTIARALQDHGAVLGDTGPSLGIAGENDPRWDDGALRDLQNLHLSDFEVVDVSPMMVSDASYEIR